MCNHFLSEYHTFRPLIRVCFHILNPATVMILFIITTFHDPRMTHIQNTHTHTHSHDPPIDHFATFRSLISAGSNSDLVSL